MPVVVVVFVSVSLVADVSTASRDMARAKDAPRECERGISVDDSGFQKQNDGMPKTIFRKKLKEKTSSRKQMNVHVRLGVPLIIGSWRILFLIV